MGKIYLNQNSLRIELETEVDINGATATLIKFEKPSGDTGEWSASVSDPGAGKIYYDLTGTELDEIGNWMLWAHVTFSDTRHAPGEPTRLVVYEESC